MASEAVFRVHFEDGTKINVTATDTAAAKIEALKRQKGIVTKIKLNRERD